MRPGRREKMYERRRTRDHRDRDSRLVEGTSPERIGKRTKIGLCPFTEDKVKRNSTN